MPNWTRATTEARREILVGIVRLQPGATVTDVLEAAKAIHAKGKWPQAEWSQARNDPYGVGIRQSLYAMRCNLLSYTDPDKPLVCLDHDRRELPRWWHRDDVGGLAESMLPEGDEAAELVRIAQRYRREHGRAVVFGVTDALVPVVRIDTGRGVLEEQVESRYGWMGALLRVGLINDEDLVLA